MKQYHLVELIILEGRNSIKISSAMSTTLIKRPLPHLYWRAEDHHLKIARLHSWVECGKMLMGISCHFQQLI